MCLQKPFHRCNYPVNATGYSAPKNDDGTLRMGLSHRNHGQFCPDRIVRGRAKPTRIAWNPLRPSCRSRLPNARHSYELRNIEALSPMPVTYRLCGLMRTGRFADTASCHCTRTSPKLLLRTNVFMSCRLWSMHFVTGGRENDSWLAESSRKGWRYPRMPNPNLEMLFGVKLRGSAASLV
jgi:hypothetical protein